MNKTLITCDSGLNPMDTACMIPGIVIDSQGKEYYDKKSMNENIPAIAMEEIFEQVEKGEVFHTSAPNIYDYYTTFQTLLEEGYDILHLSISEHVSSSSYNTSMNVIEELKTSYPGRIEGVHTKTAGSGGMILTSYAQDLAKQRQSLIELKNQVETLKEKTIGSFFISSAKGYIRSGRVPKSAHALDLLGLHYRIDTMDGKLIPKKIYKGKVNKQALKYVKELINKENIEEYDSKYIALLSMPVKEISYEEILDYIKSFHYFENILENSFYGTISAYGVKDQLGLGLIRK